MASMNKVLLLGNLGQDPEVKSTQDGRKFANLSMATAETWKDKSTGERKERTQWHRIVCWNEGLTGVIERFLAKGDQIMIEGQLETRSWEQDGAKKYATEVVLRPFNSHLTIIKCKAWEKDGGRSDDSAADERRDAASGKTTGQKSGQKDDLDDEIPF